MVAMSVIVTMRMVMLTYARKERVPRPYVYSYHPDPAMQANRIYYPESIFAERGPADVLLERVLPLIEAGVKDGSIPTEYPREAAELLSLLPNYWLMPYFYPVTLPEMEHRIRCLATMLDAIGVPIFDDELITVAAKGMMTFAGEPEKGSE